MSRYFVELFFVMDVVFQFFFSFFMFLWFQKHLFIVSSCLEYFLNDSKVISKLRNRVEYKTSYINQDLRDTTWIAQKIVHIICVTRANSSQLTQINLVLKKKIAKELAVIFYRFKLIKCVKLVLWLIFKTKRKIRII